MPSDRPIFRKVPTDFNFPSEERAIAAFWKDRRIFEKTLETRGGSPSFVLYDGPPTANGLPHNGHVLTRVLKDLFPRYKTMQGYSAPRKAGWDTHGLPVEVEVEKELRIHGKAAIEEFGIEPFIGRCIQSVFRYTDEWEKLTERIGYWTNLADAYVTYHQSYIESVWWALSELLRKGLLYQGHKVVWWWAQGGTALSSGEVGSGYKEVDDPSAYVAFPLEDEPELSLLVWTTTPWTLPSNSYAAVHPGIEYAVVKGKERRFVVASARVADLAKAFKDEFVVERTLLGAELVGKRYRPPFDHYARAMATSYVALKAGGSQPMYWRVLAADFVAIDTGTGIVHLAPAFGEDDHQAHRRELALVDDPASVPLLCAVKPDGTFDDEWPAYAGRWVKDCDKDLLAELRTRGSLVHVETYRHDYPFCWRAESDALIQYARPAWYIRTTAVIDQAIANNKKIEWLPSHVGEGRFGDFLANNVDWALSRERYWGTPLNIWVNDVSGAMEAPPSVAAILEKNPSAFDAFHAAKKADPSLNDHLMVHKPWVDNVTWQNPGEAGTYRRVPDVIDCWFDSGCMPFAQWGFPHKGREAFEANFPADFISEAIDQTRGWFYSLVMVSTLIWDEECRTRLRVKHDDGGAHPFKTCIVLGHVSDREGKKESKSKGNYTPPEVILDSVSMEFAILGSGDVPGVSPEPGVAWMCREDLEGLDLIEGATVRAYLAVAPEAARTMTVKVGKKMRRRVVVLSEGDRSALNATRTTTLDVKPVDVPRLPASERVVLEDPQSPAPGADAFRWFFYASNPPWNATRHSLSNVRSLQKEFIIKVRNVYSFFVIYATIDGFNPVDTITSGTEFANHRPTHELDRWIRSELALTTQKLVSSLDGYDVYAATQSLTTFADSLSNWYVRRSRERFWSPGWEEDKQSAYATLYGVLVQFAKLAAPFIPFMAEGMYQNLVAVPAHEANVSVDESVHLARYPQPITRDIDAELSDRMRVVRELVSLGLQVRTHHKLKVRQPLRMAHIILSESLPEEGLALAKSMIQSELNVLGLQFVPANRASDYVEYTLKPNFRTLGQRGLGKKAQELKASMARLRPDQAAEIQLTLLRDGATPYDGVELLRDDVEIGLVAKQGFAAAGDRTGVVVLDTELDDELLDLGYFRELLSRIQNERKGGGFDYIDRIALTVVGPVRACTLIQKHMDELKSEVLAVSADTRIADERARDDLSVPPWAEVELEGDAIFLKLERA